MNWPAALSGAALRVMRTAVGRRVRQRVLQVALLAGGLFVLGVVFGGQAQAADGVLGQRPVIPMVAPVSPEVVKPGPVPVPASVPVLTPVLAPVSDAVERVVRPVSDVVTKTVTEVLTEAPSLPTPPALPALPSVPAVPSQPVIPVQTPPAHTAPVSVPTPVRSVPRPSGGGHRSDARPAEVTVGVGATYGPRFVADTADALGAVGHAVVRHAPSACAGNTPTQRPAPNGDTDGADNGSSRHCDAHAVTLDNRVPVRIVPGAAARADVGETRDRYRDVPVFPG
ncbi:hypothetical protein OG588_30595 [Streptomyces prunicolor]|uniref:hypothetical protein n=1 Tax=Streptomyces prunicolor TaxID=67348 RepID=UPI003867C25C|nr:hypothetical protein OG588_30595 [Streptomyces prunicolor]